MKCILLIIPLASATIATAINPSRVYERTPDAYGLKYIEYQIKTPDDYLINVWEYKLPDTVKVERTVIFVGPDAGNMSHSIWQANFFLERGIRVISFDYRGFGKSADFEMNKDYLFYKAFATDLDSVIKVVREKYSSDKIGLYALSMGTYISLIRKEKIDFLIAEGFYHDPHEVVSRIKINKGKTVLLPEKYSTVKELKPSIPVLIFCASNDNVTTLDDAMQFSKNNKVSLVEFKGEHLSGFQVMTNKDPGDEYLLEITDFLNDNL